MLILPPPPPPPPSPPPSSSSFFPSFSLTSFSVRWLQRVQQVSQSLHYNDPLRKYVDIIIKKYPEERQKDFSRGHDDYEDFQASQDPLSKGGLESLLKKSMKAVRISNSTRM